MADTVWRDIDISPLQEYNLESHRITIESIQQALLALTKEKPFDKITIQELVNKAGVSRSAFYRNFQSKEAVMQSIVHDAFASLAKQMRKEGVRPLTQESFLRVLIGIIEQSRQLNELCNIGGWRDGTLLHYMDEYFSEFIPPVVANNDEMHMRFWMGGVHSAILYWIDSGMQESSEELARRLLSYMATD